MIRSTLGFWNDQHLSMFAFLFDKFINYFYADLNWPVKKKWKLLKVKERDYRIDYTLRRSLIVNFYLISDRLLSGSQVVTVLDLTENGCKKCNTRRLWACANNESRSRILKTMLLIHTPRIAFQMCGGGGGGGGGGHWQKRALQGVDTA
jgi:hypothetical protein